MKVTDELKQKIREANPIGDVMAEYGIEIRYDSKACCPFHEEETPSFHVYADTDSYYCYGCGAGTKGKALKRKDHTNIEDGGSDVIGFVMNIEGEAFPQACKRLMRRAGIPIPDEKVDMALEKAKDAVMQKNRRFYNSLMKTDEALDYFYDRGLDDDDIQKWRLGWVPHNDPVSKFKGRLVFSIMEDHYVPDKAKTIALAYRKFNDKENGPKYINDAGSAIYQKSTVLYGMNFAEKNIRKKRYAIVVEGYVDVISAHKTGMDNTVGICGTSFTDEQIKKLRRTTDELIIWFDGDEAGTNAAMRALPDLLTAGFSIRIVNSHGEDPADVMKRFDFKQDDVVSYMIKHAKSGIQMVIDEATQSFEVLVNQERLKALRKVLPVMEAINRPEEKYNYDNVLKQKLGLF